MIPKAEMLTRCQMAATKRPPVVQPVRFLPKWNPEQIMPNTHAAMALTALHILVLYIRFA